MEALSQVMCDAVGLANGATAVDLLNHLATSGYDFLDGLLSSDQARTYAENELRERDSYSIVVVPQIGALQERFCSIQLDGISEPARIGLLAAEPMRTLPTALENLVFWALVDPALSWHENWDQAQDVYVSSWRAKAQGQAIVALPIGSPPEALRLISALFGLKHAELGISLSAPPLLNNATSVNIAASIPNIGLVQTRLVNEAGAVAHPKWRCLALYRILEHGYLSNIKKKLLADFDADASGALGEALEKVANEINQLISLAEEADLRGEFEQFDAMIETLIASGNSFIIKLDRGAKNHTLYRSSDRYKKAVLRFYKLRCAIAHAGTSSVIYEQFSDSDQAATALLPSIETIAMKSLKISR